MPFGHVASGFHPHQLDILYVAFNDAWQQLVAANTASTRFEQSLLRKKLAQHIVAPEAPVSSTQGSSQSLPCGCF